MSPDPVWPIKGKFEHRDRRAQRDNYVKTHRENATWRRRQRPGWGIYKPRNAKDYQQITRVWARGLDRFSLTAPNSKMFLGPGNSCSRKEIRSKQLACDITFRNERAIFLLLLLLFSGESRLLGSHTLKVRAEECGTDAQPSTSATHRGNWEYIAASPPWPAGSLLLLSWTRSHVMPQQPGFRGCGASPHVPKGAALLQRSTLSKTLSASPWNARERALSERSAPTRPGSPAHAWACLYGAQILARRNFSFPNQGQALPAGPSALLVLSRVGRARIRECRTVCSSWGCKFPSALYSCLLPAPIIMPCSAQPRGLLTHFPLESWDEGPHLVPLTIWGSCMGEESPLGAFGKEMV